MYVIALIQYITIGYQIILNEADFNSLQHIFMLLYNSHCAKQRISLILVSKVVYLVVDMTMIIL